jgi:predicted small secreted protein
MNKLVFAGALLALAACNTIDGFGKDLQAAGAVLAGTATGVQNASKPATGAPPMGHTAPTNCAPDSNGLVLEGCPAPQ